MHSSNDPSKVVRAAMLLEREEDVNSYIVQCGFIAADEQEMC